MIVIRERDCHNYSVSVIAFAFLLFLRKMKLALGLGLGLVNYKRYTRRARLVSGVK